MKTLIDNIVTFLRAAVTAGDVRANIIMKGFDEADPDQVPIEKFPYVAIDDGGERVESDTAGRTQTRVYSVNLFIAVIILDPENSLDELLDLTDEVKTEFEKKANRQKDGHVWGINILPIVGETQDTQKMYRGRQVTIEFNELEDNYGEY